MNAVYAGTFDPVTCGHLDIIERASKMYDVLYVTIFVNPQKTTLFSLEERLALLKEVTKTYAKKMNAPILVRGLRATMDFEYELQLAFSNQYLDDSVDMIFLMTRPNHSYISSSSVKEIASHHRCVTGLVPPIVEKALHEKFG